MSQKPKVLPRPFGSRTPVAWLLLLLSFAFSGCGSTSPSSVEISVKRAAQERYETAKAIFEERCKTAGVVIHHTVQDVDGIELIKLRPALAWADKRYFDPLFEGAAMAREHQGENYIKQFLMYEFIDGRHPERRGELGPLTAEKGLTRPAPRKGYSFVEVPGEHGQRLRCEPDWSRDHPNWVDGQHHCRPATASSTRYALDFEDIVLPADRQYWIAGTKLKVVDKQTGQALATLTKYVWDPGFGGSTTGRWPWQHADGMSDRTCPAAPFNPIHIHSRYFIDTVLLPKQGD